MLFTIESYLFDKDGQLKNSLFGNQSFGHIDSIDVDVIVETEQFQEYWLVAKDKTAICKDCEFRFMCTDQRIPIKKNGEWTHAVSCRYNPYSTKWAWEEGFEEPIPKSFSIHEN
jgi:radical SAM protein with 4Fe4S-binding SPASM domain